MRVAAAVVAVFLGVVLFPVPASAFAHDRVNNLAVHALLDVLTLIAVSAPVWTALLWRRERRVWLVTLIAVVQTPVAVIGFIPVVDPVLHLVAGVTALTLTGFSLWYVRRATVEVATVPAQAGRR